MHTKDFFTLSIKLFALYQLGAALFYYLPNNLIYLYDISRNFSLAIWTLVPVLILSGLFLLILQYAPKVVDSLNLTKGFQSERIEFNISDTESILTLGVVFIGGMLIVENITSLLYESYQMLGEVLHIRTADSFGNVTVAGDKKNFILSLLGVGIGYLLLTNAKRVARILKKENKLDEVE